ncbi:MAG: L,D-transpeptidase family protein [Bosea sp. (in: a-proteobacteria)]
MRSVSKFCFALLLGSASSALMAGQASAQAYFSNSPQRGRSVEHTGSVGQQRPAHQPGALGGGFIEFLMTGVDPTPGSRYQPPAQTLPRPMTSRRAPAPEIDPFTGQQALPASRQMAGLQQRNEIERPIERVLDARFERQEVAYDGPHRPGTVVIDTPSKFLYLVQDNGRALRYGIGVGRPGFEWAGLKSITRKAEWPDWTPPAAMLKRRPDLPRFMPGGPENPMGARAMYLGSSLYRIHGTNEPHTIGQAVSSGCIRMTNDDVTDLYNRVRVGMRVIVI